MPPARCILCDRLLMGASPPAVAGDVGNPDALVLCVVCEALPAADRKERRGQVMMRMLDDAMTQRRRRHG
jgi:hypothetical protein